MKTVLIIIPHEYIYPPMNGGMLRCFHILHQLTKYFKVTAIVRQEEKEFTSVRDKYPEFKNCEIISTKAVAPVRDIFSFLPEKVRNAIRFRYWKGTWKGPADSFFLENYPVLSKLLKAKRFDYIILENLATLNVVPVIRRLVSDSVILYDAHNVDSNLILQLTGNNKNSKEYKLVWQRESNLYKLVDGLLTCSEKDMEEFKKMNAGNLKTVVIPNGVEIIPDALQSINFSHDKSNRLIFCGSLDYEPNRQGLEWFCKEIFPLLLKEIPSVQLMVIGAGNPGENLKEILQQPSIKYYGRVNNVDDYYRKAAVAIVPLLTGSGTRLKILEAMSRKVSIVSTAKGAEGIEYTADKTLCVANDAFSFAQAVLKLLRNREMAKSIEEEAFQFVQLKYDWNIIGKNLVYYLNQTIPNS